MDQIVRTRHSVVNPVVAADFIFNSID